MKRKQEMHIDPAYYSKQEMKKQLNLLGKIMCRIGAARSYLDGRQWYIWFNWWHPASWIVLLAYGVCSFGVNIIEVVRSATMPNGSKSNLGSNAPGKVIVYDTFVAEPQNDEEWDNANKGLNFFAARVWQRLDSMCVSVGETVRDVTLDGNVKIKYIHIERRPRFGGPTVEFYYHYEREKLDFSDIAKIEQ